MAETDDGESGAPEARDPQETQPTATGLLPLWFGLSADVGPRVYAATGFGVMAFKYAVEAGLIWLLAGRVFTPLDFFNPLLSLRQEFFTAPAPDWLAWAFFFWTLPFLWVAVGMSVRRAANAGLSAWVGLIVLVPFLNFVGMLLLCVLPHRPGCEWVSRNIEPKHQHQLKSALIGVASSLAIALVMVGIGVYGLKDYGVTLFLGTPIWMGAVSAFL